MTYEEANLDSLTGLRNVKEMTKDINACLEDKQAGYLMFVGIDNIKNINAKYGRKYGSNILREVGQVLGRIAGDQYKAYRLDGDKFAIHMPGGTKSTAEHMYEQLKNEPGLKCTLSSGVASYKGNQEEDADLLYQHAENALDRAKRRGKNNQVFFSAAVYKRQMNLMELEEELKENVKNNFQGFYLNYQPQISCGTYEIQGVETLLRYESPTKGKIRPDDFVPLLEKTQLMIDVGRWVLMNALEQCKEWRKTMPHLHVSVNVSTLQIEQDGFGENVLMMLDNYQLPGEALTLEVTESIQVHDYSYLNEIFQELKARGVKLSIDDFGTGYSSLSYLRNIAIDEIKIDRCFVKNIQKNTYNYQLIKNMIELAHSYGINVCCEGVETTEELAVLKNIQPNLLQGYLFSEPCSTKEFDRRYLAKETEIYQDYRRQEAFYRALSNRDKVDELGNSLERYFYRAILGDTLAYAEIDLDKRQIINMGGLWEPYMGAEYEQKSYEEVMVANQEIVVHPEDVKLYEEFIRSDFINAIKKKKRDTRRIQFRRLIDGEMCWVEMTGYLFHEELTGKHYALLYLKDINVRKRKEIEYEVKATRDTLTGVYRRTTFEAEVVKHVQASRERVAGTMIIIDMDHFKQINDVYGHVEGDKVLKDLSDVLFSTFRRKDLIGRIGGDEFVIFLKNVSKEETINHRMEELREKLLKANNHNMTCSVGITFVETSGFSYENSFKEADTALYVSKKNGRDRYTYYNNVKS